MMRPAGRIWTMDVRPVRVEVPGLAARARAEERNRIARELHDVIAHTLTVLLLHVSSARLASMCQLRLPAVASPLTVPATASLARPVAT